MGRKHLWHKTRITLEGYVKVVDTSSIRSRNHRRGNKKYTEHILEVYIPRELLGHKKIYIVVV